MAEIKLNLVYFTPKSPRKLTNFPIRGRHNGRNDNNFLMNDTAALFFVPDSFPRLSANDRERERETSKCPPVQVQWKSTDILLSFLCGANRTPSLTGGCFIRRKKSERATRRWKRYSPTPCRFFIDVCFLQKRKNGFCEKQFSISSFF